MNTQLNKTVERIRRRGFLKCRDNAKSSCWEERDYVEGTVNVGVIILPTLGCAWGRKSGCTMCGYAYSSSSNTQREIIVQFKDAIERLEDIEYLKIFNSGSFFDKREISENTATKIFEKINGVTKISNVQVESRPEFIDSTTLEKASKTLSAKLEVGIGLETSSDYIRENCINKNFTFDDFKKSVEICKKQGVDVKVYLLLKPPFLTEREAIDDTIKSAIDAYKLGVSRISINPVNVQRYTLVEHLWQRGEYRAPWLWSLLEVLKSIEKKVKIPVLSHPTAAGKRRGTHNCRKCDSRVYYSIMNFSTTQNPVHLDVDCECKEKWKKYVELEHLENGPYVV